MLEGEPGKEREVEEFLKSAQPLAEREEGTLTSYAVKISPSQFGIFDTFATESGREAYLASDIAKTLVAKAKELFGMDPELHKIDVIAAKAHLAESKQNGAHH